MEVKNNVGEEKKHSRSFCFMICNETVTRSLNTMDANSAVFFFFFKSILCFLDGGRFILNWIQYWLRVRETWLLL